MPGVNSWPATWWEGVSGTDNAAVLAGDDDRGIARDRRPVRDHIQYREIRPGGLGAIGLDEQAAVRVCPQTIRIAERIFRPVRVLRQQENVPL